VGLDFALLGRLRDDFPTVELVAGGGVRGREDLEQLAEVGVDGALVATALHTGALTRSDLVSVGACSG
jgi:phosphoribosylformimino-5-aminoimidazole carboxamide ribotide isomerase